MLEKIGLPAKPSLRGNTWVVDASHCQGCSSQFTFINRKHHCRRCGGLFCGSCTQQRMYLRGQGDSPVRICDPCKTLEEAARFELRHGYKNKAAKAGSSKRTVKNEDDVLSEILGSDVDVSSSSESVSSTDRVTSKEMASSSSNKDMELDGVSASPEELRKQAVEEKNKHRVLKREGKSEEALKAFKRGKELERQAEALEISLKKNRKRVLSMQNVGETQNKAPTKESSKSQKPPRRGGKGNDDLAAALKELGWSDDEDKKPANVSLEGEFSSLLREIPGRTNPKQSGGIDKSQVIAIKRKALALKREGKLSEAKEELKRAKILERELEEQELLGGADESDDELSALINSMEDDKEDGLLAQYEGSHDFDISNLVGNVDDIGVHGEYDVTDEDMEDPAITAALKSLGWSEEPRHRENLHPKPSPKTREESLAEIQTLKREALTLKRAGNVTEAMATLKKAKLLEKELDADDTSSPNVDMTMAERDMSLKHPPRSRLAIQKELLAVKKKALTLRREGKLNEAEEELKKGEALQNQLDELDNSSKLAAAGKASREKGNDLPDISMNSLDDDGDVDVKDEELNDPNYLSMLKNLGWNDEDNKNPPEPVSSQPGKRSETQDAYEIRRTKPQRSKAEIQRELLGLKRKALTLRRQGNVEEADQVLNQTKILEAEMTEIDSGKNVYAEIDQIKKTSIDSGINEGDDSVTENDMKDPALLSNLKNMGWEDEESKKEEPASSSMMDLMTGEHNESSQTVTREESVQNVSPENNLKQEILSQKRKALALKKEGKIGEAKEALVQAKLLEKKLLQEGENDDMVSVTTQAKENSPSSSVAPKAMSSRDRFKIQQESLSHKRQAMKLRREGKMEEAEAEFEIAKNLEAQLEDSTSSSKPESVDDVAVEDFLDPQLLSALKAIGLDNSINPSSTSTNTAQTAAKPVKPTPVKESNDQERSQLEEMIKAEKVKAVTLKRAGKQTEALDALRRAKLYEKKLNALASN